MPKMETTEGQKHAIQMALNYFNNSEYNSHKSYIIYVNGNDVVKNERDYFVGEFVAHVYRKGNFRFNCYFEGLYGWYAVEHSKLQTKK